MTAPTHTPRRDRGAIIPLVALALPVLILMVAFAVDLGIQRSNRRTMQARADIVALDLARLANGRTLYEIMNDSSPSYLNSLNGSAARNEVPVSELTIEFGSWNGTTFSPLVPGIHDDAVPNAVRVTGRRVQDYFFQPGSGRVERSAIALNGWAGPPCGPPPCVPDPPPPCGPPPCDPPPCEPQPCDPPVFGDAVVDLTVGSVGARFQPSVPNSVGLSATVEALNSRLAAQFGATVPNPGSAGFDLLGYRGLAVGYADLWRLAANAGFASPDALLGNSLSVGQFFDASVAALDQQAAEGDPNAASAATQLRRFQTQMGVDNTATMVLGDTIDYEQGGDSAAAVGSINVLDLLSAGAEVINGNNFASYGLSSGIPGVTIVNVDQFLVSKATFKPGLSLNGYADNKQIRLQVDLQVAPLAGMTAPVRIPLVIEAATARGTVDALACADPLADSQVDIGVDTSGLTVRLGTAADLSAANLVVNQGVLLDGGVFTLGVLVGLGLSPAQALGFNLNGQTTGTASASVLGGSSSHVFFPYQDPTPYQRAPGGAGAGSLGAQLKSSFSASLGNALLPATARTNIANQLNYVFNNVEASIIDPLLASSGVTIAGADVLADNLRCTGAGVVLVK